MLMYVRVKCSCQVSSSSAGEGKTIAEIEVTMSFYDNHKKYRVSIEYETHHFSVCVSSARVLKKNYARNSQAFKEIENLPSLFKCVRRELFMSFTIL